MSMFSKIQTQGGGPKTFIKQSLPVKMVCCFDWWFQPRSFGEAHDWKPNFIIWYSIFGFFRLSRSSRNDTMNLNSGQLASKSREISLNFWKKCFKIILFKEIDTKYWDKRFQKLLSVCHLTFMLHGVKLWKFFSHKFQHVKYSRVTTRRRKSSLYWWTTNRFQVEKSVKDFSGLITVSMFGLPQVWSCPLRPWF